MPSPPAWNKKVLLLILITAAFRVIIGASVELGNDEVYYWTYSKHLQWNYFDHPPLVAVWIRFFTLNLSLENFELFIRLGSIISCGIATWLIYKTTSLLDSERAGWYAACLYNGSIYASIIAGLFILPDSPQMLFWTLCLYLLTRIHQRIHSWSLWSLFGIAVGLCIMSKVHGIFIWLGLGLYILSKKRNWLRLPQVYLAAIISAAIASPILIWNIQNHFATYAYHSQRISIQHFSINTDGFLREFIGQILYNNPLNVWLIIMALRQWNKKRLSLPPTVMLFNFIALPMAALLLLISLFRDTLPHWSGPAYVSLLPLAAIALADKYKEGAGSWPAIMKYDLGLPAFALFGGWLLIHFFPGTLGNKTIQERGTGDFTLDMQGWRKTGIQFNSWYKKAVTLHLINSRTPVVSYKWFPAAHEDYYFCRPSGLAMIGLGNMEDLHHYIWLNQQRVPQTNMDTAICIVPSNEYYDPHTTYQDYYQHIDSIGTLDSYRSATLARRFYIYLLRNLKKSPPSPLQPD